MAESTSLASLSSLLSLCRTYITSLGIQKLQEEDITMMNPLKEEFFHSIVNCQRLSKLSFVGTNLCPDDIHAIIFSVISPLQEIQIKDYQSSLDFMFLPNSQDISPTEDNFNSLETLKITNCPMFTDFGLMQLNRMVLLKYLDLSRTNITCEFECDLSLHNLETLKLSHCRHEVLFFNIKSLFI